MLRPHLATCDTELVKPIFASSLERTKHFKESELLDQWLHSPSLEFLSVDSDCGTHVQVIVVSRRTLVCFSLSEPVLIVGGCVRVQLRPAAEYGSINTEH